MRTHTAVRPPAEQPVQRGGSLISSDNYSLLFCANELSVSNYFLLFCANELSVYKLFESSTVALVKERFRPAVTRTASVLMLSVRCVLLAGRYKR